jgi:hypothetical protein
MLVGEFRDPIEGGGNPVPEDYPDARELGKKRKMTLAAGENLGPRNRAHRPAGEPGASVVANTDDRYCPRPAQFLTSVERSRSA